MTVILRAMSRPWKHLRSTLRASTAAHNQFSARKITSFLVRCLVMAMGVVIYLKVGQLAMLAFVGIAAILLLEVFAALHRRDQAHTQS